VSALTVDEIIKKNIEARGGYKNIKSIKSVKASGKFMSQGIEATAHMYIKRPHFLRQEMIVQGKSVIQAYNGKIAWWINPFFGIAEPTKMPENEGTDIIIESDFDGPLVDYKKKGNTVELVGKEDLEGTPAYKIKVTLKNGRVFLKLFDAKTFLEIKTMTKVKRMGTELEVESYSSNYKKVNGVMLAHTFESKFSGRTLEKLMVEKIEANVEIEDALFDMPEKSTPETKKK
jgi:hypothetical protein